MLVVLFDVRGIVHVANHKHRGRNLLLGILQDTEKDGRNYVMNAWMFHYDNMQNHRAYVVNNYLIRI